MSFRYQIIATIILIILAFASGKYSVQKPEIKETESSQTQKQTNEVTDTKTVTHIVEQPSGVKETTTTTETNTHVVETEKTKQKETVDVIPPKINTWNILALAGISGFKSPTYGASITKQVLGPVNIGIFGLTNNTFGVSLGVSF